MNKTMQSIMKPLDPTTVRVNSEDTKRAQEAVIMTILTKNPYSMTSRDIAMVIKPNLSTFPGYNERFGRETSEFGKAVLMASKVCRRLEGKGEIISTLYRGRRLYSTPVQEGGEN